jgi:hypothetical protein
MYVTCPTCTATLSVAEDSAGKVVACPHCQQKLMVPAADPAPVPAAVQAPAIPAPAPAPAPVAPKAVATSGSSAVPKTVTASGNTAVASGRVSALGPIAPPTPVRGPGGEIVYQTNCFGCTTKLMVLENPPEQLPICDKCRQAFTARRLRKPFSVRVAAAALRWPSYCACCCKRANSMQRLTHAQKTDSADAITGEAHAWDVPYCLHCIEHVKYQKQANAMVAGAAEDLKRANKKLEVAARKEGRVSARPIIIGVIWGTLVFLLGMGAFNPLVLSLLFFRQSQPGSLIGPWLGISGIFFGVGVALGILLWFLGRQKALSEGIRKADRAEKKLEDAQLDFQRAQTFAQNTQSQAQSFLQPTCAAADIAVHYVGWEGYTHVFYFDSEPYAVAFVAMNRGNVVEPKMM